MAKKIDIKTLFAAKQEEMLSVANFSKTLNHPTDKGNNSENNWLQLFNNYLPRRYKADKATIIDSNGDMSNQIDIVLYDAQYSYLAFFKDNIKYVPAESVYAIFEVKQDLSIDNLKYACKIAERVRKLYRTSAPIPYAGGIYNPKPLPRILAGVLSNYSRRKDVFGKSFKGFLSSIGEKQQIDIGCILSSGSFYYDYDKSILKNSQKDESLIFFFLQLLILLQEMATVPAIELPKYMKLLSVKEDKQ